MSRNPGWPPSHRNPEDLQPEVCDLCNLQVGGKHLTLILEGKLAGTSVCDVRHGCREFYRKLSGHDFVKIYDPSPVYEDNTKWYPPGSGIDIFEG